MRPFSLIRMVRELARRARGLRRELGLAAMLAFCATLSLPLRHAVASCWHLAARDAQLRPADCRQIWVLQWGRGSGKTRSASEHTLDVMEEWGSGFSGCLVSKTYGDVLTTMINDPGSGIIACARRRGVELRHVAGQSKDGGPFLEHPNGARLYYRSAERQIRGLNLNFFWCDEIADWPRNALKMFQAFIGAWRMKAPDGGSPIGVITTTPQRNAIMRWLLSTERADLITVTRQHSHDNAAHIDVASLERAYVKGTDGYRQEVEGVMLDEGSNLTPAQIDAFRVDETPDPATLRKIVVVDPAGEKHEKADAVGIIGLGADFTGVHAECYVMGDRTVTRMSPREWARAAVDYAIEIDACKILVEKNYGGLMSEDLIRVAMEEVERETGSAVTIEIESRNVDGDKRLRATAPISLVQGGRVHFVGHLPELEKEIVEWIPGEPSPNRMDAWSMGVADLLLPDGPKAWSIGDMRD